MDGSKGRTSCIEPISDQPYPSEDVLEKNSFPDIDTGKTPAPKETTEISTTTNPCPDGGVTAWMQVLAGHLVCLSCWGYTVSFGIFQPTYVEMLSVSPSTISWIGSIQLFLAFFVGAFSGRLYDAGYLKPALLIGAVLQLVGIFTSSLSTEYWHLFLSQGVAMGVGFGMVFPPLIAHVSTYFSSKKVVAMAVTSTGSATGGLIFPLIAQQLLPRVGFGWTVRTMGLVMLVSYVIVLAVTRTNLPPRRSGPLIEWGAFKELPFAFYSIASFFVVWSLFFGYYYARAYALDFLDATQSQSFNILIIINVAGIPGRLLPAVIADRYTGPLTMFAVWTLATGICIFSWMAVHTVTATYVWAFFFGSFGAGIMSLFPAAASTLCEDPRKVGGRIGLVFTLVSVPSLTGAPLAGKLIQVSNGSYTGAQIWGGLCMILSTGLLIVASSANSQGERWRMLRRSK